MPATPRLVSLLSLLPLLASLHAAAFELPASGCPMAHCDARMSDWVSLEAPLAGQRVAFDRSSAGAKGGLGCVSNGTLAACTGGADPATKSNLTVYDADGRRLWEDGGLLGSTAWLSAALISTDGHVIAADQDWLLRADPLTDRIVWRTAKPDAGTPISPVLAGQDSGMVLVATKAPASGGTPELSVWDAETGALLHHAPIVDPVTGAVYATLNTPAVQGNRAYVLTSNIADGDDGRLIAIDLCESEACGGRGRWNVAWHFSFDGPSSASPVLIGQRLFFDGLRGPRTGLFMAIDDLGAAPAAAWSRSYSGRFGASAAQDPRGGLWIYPWQSGKLLRVGQVTGAVQQEIDLTTLLGLPPGFSPVTAVSVSAAPAGAVALTFGIKTTATTGDLSTYVVAVDVSEPAGRELWRHRVAANASINAPTGQFPIVVNDQGARRVVFRGTRSGTFFVGEP